MMPESVTNAVFGVALIIIAGSLIGWAIAMMRCARREPAYPYQPRRPVPWGLLDLALIVFFAFAAMVMAYALFSSLLGIRIGTSPTDLEPRLLSALMICDSATTVAVLVVACGYLVWRVRARLPDLGVDGRHIGADMGLGLAAFLMLVVPVYAIQILLTWLVPEQAKHPLITMIETNADPLMLLAAMIVAVVVAPVVEEMVFRVMLQGWLEKMADSRGNLQELIFGAAPIHMTDPPVVADIGSADESWPERGSDETSDATVASPSADQPDVDGVGLSAAVDEVTNPYTSPQAVETEPPVPTPSAATGRKPRRWPIFVSAAIFSAMHLGHGYDFVALFVLALGLGYLYQQTHRVVPCIVVHLLLNAGSLVMLWLSVTYGDMP